MTAPYENAEFIELGTIMPPEKFRTVLPEDRDAPGGLTEQKVVIEFRRDRQIQRRLRREGLGLHRVSRCLGAALGDQHDDQNQQHKRRDRDQHRQISAQPQAFFSYSLSYLHRHDVLAGSADVYSPRSIFMIMIPQLFANSNSS